MRKLFQATLASWLHSTPQVIHQACTLAIWGGRLLNILAFFSILFRTTQWGSHRYHPKRTTPPMMLEVGGVKFWRETLCFVSITNCEYLSTTWAIQRQTCKKRLERNIFQSAFFPGLWWIAKYAPRICDFWYPKQWEHYLCCWTVLNFWCTPGLVAFKFHKNKI